MKQKQKQKQQVVVVLQRQHMRISSCKGFGEILLSLKTHPLVDGG